SERECVWYRYSIEEEWRKTETYTDSKGNRRTRTSSGWTTIKSADVRDPFFLRDDTGRIRIVPDGADMEGERAVSHVCSSYDPMYYGKGPMMAIAHSTGRRRFTEDLIPPRAPLYVMGCARLRDDAVEPEVACDDEEEMYLISMRSEEQILRSYGIWAPVQLMLGAVLLNGSAFVGLAAPSFQAFDGAETLARAWPVMVAGSVLYALSIFVYYLVLLYNGLVSVRNRVANAWSQIDIQLKRRFDLIPNLVACVKGYAKHERDVMESLAKIRVEGLAAGGAGGGRVPVGGAALAYASFADAQTHALSSIYGLVERYPEIKADRSFGKLQDELARTETKIALARTFYNESVTALNNRIETLPDALIAKPGGFKAIDYFKIEEIEKRPVLVKLELEKPPARTDAAPERETRASGSAGPAEKRRERS
ncbi:MAG TPA: LemA family protein, partial [Planctomycetota bacterium]|nr:LemA family protein [Planctomycetota bacterium]